MRTTSNMNSLFTSNASAARAVEPSQQPASKLPYSSPTLKEYGSVRKLTMTKIGTKFDGVEGKRA
jgi:hypothetical protein